MQRGMNVLALVKDSERYVFLYDDDSPAALLQTLGRFAADPGTQLHLVRRCHPEPEGPPAAAASPRRRCRHSSAYAG